MYKVVRTLDLLSQTLFDSKYYIIISFLLFNTSLFSQNNENQWIFSVGYSAVDLYPSGAKEGKPYYSQGKVFEDFFNVSDHWNFGGPTISVSKLIVKSFYLGIEMSINEIKKIETFFHKKIINTKDLIKLLNDPSTEDFNELKEWIMETKFDRLGCFAYSHEENTHAYSLVDDVSTKIKQERINSVMEIQSQISLELNQKKINQVYKCVIDRKEGAFYVGRTEHDSPDVDNEVLVDASENYLKIGDFTNLKITSSTEFDLYGSPFS